MMGVVGSHTQSVADSSPACGTGWNL